MSFTINNSINLDFVNAVNNTTELNCINNGYGFMEMLHIT